MRERDFKRDSKKMTERNSANKLFWGKNENDWDLRKIVLINYFDENDWEK